MFKIERVKLKTKSLELNKKSKNSKLALSQKFDSLRSFNKESGSEFGLQINEKIIGKWQIEEELRCMICWKAIDLKEKISRCTGCNNRFHENHWKKWIDSKHSCPVCKAKSS